MYLGYYLANSWLPPATRLRPSGALKRYLDSSKIKRMPVLKSLVLVDMALYKYFIYGYKKIINFQTKFLQSWHLHFFGSHPLPFWLHSQYFLRQFDFLQVQPSNTYTFLKALGSLVVIFRRASLISSECSEQLWQPLQMHLSSHRNPRAKHSQYFFRHLLLLHLQKTVSSGNFLFS